MPTPEDFRRLYAAFDAAMTDVDCGAKCAPYNEYGVPFCCDPRHAVPTLYRAEWRLLRPTGLWRLWQGEDAAETRRLWEETPDYQVPAVCAGPEAMCGAHRGWRSIVCRSFPFFPYLSREGAFLGLTYYWQYEDRCWVISHLGRVRLEFRRQFVAAYERLFALYPQERETFRHHSTVMRRVFGRRHAEIPLLHRDGGYYWVRPRDGRLRPAQPEDFPKYGVYALAAQMPFPDELDDAPRAAHDAAG